MSDFITSVNYLLANEGGHYEDPSTGEISNFGVSLRWLQTVQPTATAEDIRNLIRGQAVTLYEKYWWDQYKINLIDNTNVATKLLDICVNCGPVTGIKMLQTCLNEPIADTSLHMAVDGMIGPIVVSQVAAECAMPDGEYGLLSCLVSYLEDHYRAIAAANPVLAKNLDGWLARAEKLPESL